MERVERLSIMKLPVAMYYYRSGQVVGRVAMGKDAGMVNPRVWAIWTKLRFVFGVVREVCDGLLLLMT